MSVPFTHNAVAISLLNECIDIHRAQQARGLAGILSHQRSKNQPDLAGPQWAQSRNSWSLERISADGFFEFRLQDRPTSRLFSPQANLPESIELTAVETAAAFPELAQELHRYQASAGILDDWGDAYSRIERVLIQLQSQARNLSRTADRSAQEDTGSGASLVRASQPALEEALRDNLRAMTDWIKLPSELPEHFGAALSTGRLSTDPRKLARDRLLYLPQLPLPPGQRDFGGLELVVLTNGSDAAPSRRDMTSYIRDELKSTVSAAAAAAVSWSDLQRILRADLDHFTATTRQFIESRLCAFAMVLREAETGRALVVALGNISAYRFSRATCGLEPLVYSQTISGLYRLAVDLGLTQPDAQRFVYHFICRQITAAAFEEISEQKVAAFWEGFAQRNTDALSEGSSRAGASQLHHIAIAGMGGNREDYALAWKMARTLAGLFEQLHPERYPSGLSAAPWLRLSRSFMDINAVTLSPGERLLLGSGGFNQLIDVLSLVHTGLAELPMARMVLTRADPQRTAEWMHMLHSRLACSEDMAAVVLDNPPQLRPSKDELVRGVSQRDTGTIYRRYRYDLAADQAAMAKPCILARPEQERPLGILVHPQRALALQTWLATPRRKRGTLDTTHARYIERYSATPFGRALSHRLTFSSPFHDAGKLVTHLKRTLKPSPSRAAPYANTLPIEERLAAPGRVAPFLAQTTLWLILRANLPIDGPVKLLYRWISRDGNPPEPVVELIRGSKVEVYSLYTAKVSTTASVFYAGSVLEHPTVAYVRQSIHKAKSTSPHRDRQRKRLHRIAKHSDRALPAPDEDTGLYTTLRLDRRGRLLTETGRRLPEAAKPELRGLLAAPKD